MSSCTPVQKGTYPFCVDWSGTGLVASDCSEQVDRTPTPIANTTPTPSNYDPKYTPISEDEDPPLQPNQ